MVRRRFTESFEKPEMEEVKTVEVDLCDANGNHVEFVQIPLRPPFYYYPELITWNSSFFIVDLAANAEIQAYHEADGIVCVNEPPMLTASKPGVYRSKGGLRTENFVSVSRQPSPLDKLEEESRKAYDESIQWLG